MNRRTIQNTFFQILLTKLLFILLGVDFLNFVPLKVHSFAAEHVTCQDCEEDDERAVKEWHGHKNRPIMPVSKNT